MTDDLRALIEAVEAGTERPEDIAKAFGVRPWNKYPHHKAAHSLDAAAALVAEVLPGWRWVTDNDGHANVRSFSADYPVYCGHVHGNPARALLLAALRAKMTDEAAE